MARQRRTLGVNFDGKGDKGTNSSSSNGSTAGGKPKMKTNNNSIVSYWKHLIGFIFFAVAAGISYMGYLETRVNTPFDDKKVYDK